MRIARPPQGMDFNDMLVERKSRTMRARNEPRRYEQTRGTPLPLPLTGPRTSAIPSQDLPIGLRRTPARLLHRTLWRGLSR